MASSRTIARAAPVGGLFRIILFVYSGAFFTLLYLPILLIVLLSFNNSGSVGFPFGGFTMKWYAEVLSTPDFMEAVGHSVEVGIASSVIATILAMLLGLAFRRQWRMKAFVFNMVLLPIAVPGIVGGVVLLLLFGYLGVRSSLWTTVLVAHVNWVLPFAFLTLYPRLESLKFSIEEAAMDLGARPVEVFLHVVFPIIRPALLATALFSFSLSFDEFVRTLFVAGGERTVPLLFWSTISNEAGPQIPAMGVIILLISATAAIMAFSLSRGMGPRKATVKARSLRRKPG